MDMHSFKKITYNYYRKAPLKYEADGTTTPVYPNNDAPFWCFGYAKVDGTGPDVVTQNVTVTTQCSMTYKDA